MKIFKKTIRHRNTYSKGELVKSETFDHKGCLRVIIGVSDPSDKNISVKTWYYPSEFQKLCTKLKNMFKRLVLW